MRTVQKPGQYLVGFLRGDGTEYCKCRCPVCWHEFAYDHHESIEMLTSQPVKLVCELCRQEREYIDGYETSQATLTYPIKRTKVRSKGSKADPPLFSGFDIGYDVRHKGVK